MAVVDLDALVNEARLPRARLFGREVLVRPISGAAAHRLAVAQDADPSGVSLIGALLDVVRTSCPSLTEEEVAALSVEQLGALIQLTRGQVSEVEAALSAQHGAGDAAGN